MASTLNRQLGLTYVVIGVLVTAFIASWFGTRQLLPQFNQATPQTREAPTDPNEESEVAVFFQKSDGIYRVSSSQLEAKKITPLESLGPSLSPTYAVAGEHGESVFSVHFVSKKISNYGEDPVQVLSQVRRTDVATGKTTVLHSFDSATPYWFGGLATSPNKSMVAFVAGEVAELPNPGPDFLFVWNADGTKLYQHPFTSEDYSTGGFGGWINDTTLLLSQSYEGAVFCPYVVSSSPPTMECQKAGERGYTSDWKVILQEGLDQWSVSRQYEAIEFAGSEEKPSGIYRHAPGERATAQQVHSGFLSEIWPASNVFYGIQKDLTISNSWQSSGDIVRIQRDGSTVERLTNTAVINQIKAGLNASTSQRYITWYEYFNTGIDAFDPEAVLGASSVWVLDTELNRLLKISDQAILPTVVHAQ